MTAYLYCMSQRKYTDQSLKSLIGDMLKNSGLERRFTELEIIECYKKAVGPIIVNKTISVKVREKTLVLQLDSAPLRQELSLQKTKLKQVINEQLGISLIEEIEIR